MQQRLRSTIYARCAQICSTKTTRSAMYAAWPKRCEEWLNTLGVLKPDAGR